MHPTRFLLVAGSLLALSTAPLLASEQADADNTGRNKQANQGPVADKQPQGSADVELAGAVRRAVVGADDLSMGAKNVKIVAEGDKVTLRGPVKSAAEKTRIEELAKQAGAKTVQNDLEVNAAKQNE